MIESTAANAEAAGGPERSISYTETRPPAPMFIEFEISSYCNRHCSWCPNSLNRRGDEQRLVDDQLWIGFLHELASADYAGWLAFHNYNEPLLAANLMRCIETARQISPSAKLRLYSNGDYLTADKLGEFAGSGISELRITLYPPKAHTVYDTAEAHRRIIRFIRRIRLEERLVSIAQSHRGVEGHAFIGDLELTAVASNPLLYTNRATDLGKKEGRTQPCHVPSLAAAIDVDGNLKLCCQFQDVKAAENVPYRIGNIAGGNFWKLWNGEAMARYRAMLARADFTGLPKCAACDKLP